MPGFGATKKDTIVQKGAKKVASHNKNAECPENKGKTGAKSKKSFGLWQKSPPWPDGLNNCSNEKIGIYAGGCCQLMCVPGSGVPYPCSRWLKRLNTGVS